MNKSLWSFHHPQQLRSEKSCSFNRFKTDTFSSRRRLPSRVSLCLCVSLKTLVHTGAAKFAIPLWCFRFLPEQEQQNETREKRGMQEKGEREEMRRWCCATCFETVSRGMTSFCGGILVQAAAGAEIFVRVYRYSQNPISRGLIIKYELTAYHELLYSIKFYLWLDWVRVHDSPSLINFLLSNIIGLKEHFRISVICWLICWILNFIVFFNFLENIKNVKKIRGSIYIKLILIII